MPACTDFRTVFNLTRKDLAFCPWTFGFVLTVSIYLKALHKSWLMVTMARHTRTAITFSIYRQAQRLKCVFTPQTRTRQFTLAAQSLVITQDQQFLGLSQTSKESLNHDGTCVCRPYTCTCSSWLHRQTASAPEPRLHQRICIEDT